MTSARDLLDEAGSETGLRSQAARDLAQGLALCDIAESLNRIADAMSQPRSQPARPPLVGACGHGKMAARGGTSWQGWSGPLPWAHVRLGEGPLDFCDQPPEVDR